MLILVYSHSRDFLNNHETAIRDAGYQCICTNSDDEAVETLRTQPVDVAYLHTSSLGDEFDRLLFILNAFNHGGTLVLSCLELDEGKTTAPVPRGVHDNIYTCNNDPRPFISRLRNVSNSKTYSKHDSCYKDFSIQSFSISNASFNWSFSCHADIKAIRDNDILERLTRGSQFFQVPNEHCRNISIILTELYNNAIDHGVLNLPSDLKQGADGFSKYYELRLNQLSSIKTGFIDISMSQRTSGSKAEFSIHIKDSGKGFDYSGLSQKDSTSLPYGRGLLIINKLCSSIEYSGCGNAVTVTYEWRI